MASFPEAKESVEKKQAKIMALMATLASSVEVCKKLMFARCERDRKSKSKFGL